ncbi:peptidase M48 Ste24p [Desulfovibrio sp. X2]|uniref:M48 family metallopeptidase n=1 Tax=Desulfovibrio sp. X2 TaxID=941449 RepID=UPI000358F136|nr:M48 family metallopeptidase [Desulfovibrio sp. X2]EPR42472.1 peptidase M48 Ste24p [Desulfovibrio sp. X2]
MTYKPPRLRDAFLPAILTAALVVLPTLFLSIAPARAALFDFTIKDEAELGRKFELAVRSQMPIIEDPEIKGYIQDLANRLVAVMPPQPWTIKTNVIRSSVLNAFAGPAGHVFIYSGLILSLEHESDLAGVMAHEFGHVAERHLAQNIERAQIIGPMALLGMLAGAFLGSGSTKAALAVGSGAMAQSTMLAYSRENEREADQDGLTYVTKAGFNPWGLVRGFKVLQRKQWYAGQNIPTYLATHPGLDERINYLSGRVELLPKNIQDRPEHDGRFLRVQTLLRSRYSDTTLAMGFYEQKPKAEWTAVDYMGYGILLERLNRMGDAREQFEKALSMSPMDSLVVREAGRFYFQTGDFDRASLLLQKAVMLNSHDLMALFFYARLLGEQKEYAQAIDYMERIEKRLPDDSEIRFYLGRFYGESGNLFQGHLQLAYSGLYKNDKKQAEFQRKQAEQFSKTEDDKKALEDFDKALNERAEMW